MIFYVFLFCVIWILCSAWSAWISGYRKRTLSPSSAFWARWVDVAAIIYILAFVIQTLL